ncbi:hypothetical protein TNCV_203651 [Trichonephila clavipes]|nr:hypothetical protein TNCV_203651 [Trichonephila clavipes]
MVTGAIVDRAFGFTFDSNILFKSQFAHIFIKLFKNVCCSFVVMWNFANRIENSVTGHGLRQTRIEELCKSPKLGVGSSGIDVSA